MSESDMRAMRLEARDGHFPVRRAILREELSAPTSATVELRVLRDPGLSGLVDSDVRLVFTKGGGAAREVSLRVRAVRFLGHREGLLAFELELKAKLWFLNLSKNTRKFRDLSARSVVAKVIGSRVALQLQLAREPWVLPYVVQYDETDLQFVSRLLEREGIYYTIEDDGSVVLCDTSSAAESFAPHAPLLLNTARGALSHASEALLTLSRGTRVGPGRATVNDYHWKTPSLPLIQSAEGARDKLLENYDYPSGYRLPDQGKTLARLRLESFEARKRFIRGETSFIALRPGRSMSIAHTDGISFDGDYLLVSVTHEFRHAADGRATSSNRFEAIPLNVPFRPAIRAPRPEVGGFDTAVVRGPSGEEIHTDTHGRCKVQFHWDREAKETDEDSRWLRVLQETSSSMTLARVGWEVAVQYLHSDPERPLVVARLINGQMVPMYSQPANQNVTSIRTESYPGKKGYNEIRIDDTSGAQQVHIRAEQQQLVVVEHDKRERVGHDERYTIMDHASRRVDKHQKLAVGDDLDVSVGKDEEQTVQKDRTEVIGGDEAIKAGGAITLDVAHNESETIGSLRTTLAGGIEIPKIPGSIEPLKGALKPSISKPDGGALLKQAAQDPSKAGEAISQSLKQSIPTPQSIKGSAQGALGGALSPPPLQSLLSGNISRIIGETLKRTVGGAMIALAGGGISVSAHQMLAELVGGLRVLVGKDGDVAAASAGDFVRIVGGMVLKKAGKDVSHSAETSKVTVAGKAELTAREKLEVRGQTVKIEAKRRVRLAKGDLAIEMTPETIKLAGSVKLTSKDRIQVKGAPDNVTKD